MKIPFSFRPKPTILLQFLTAMFAAKHMPDRTIESPDKSGGQQHRISKKERKRRDRCRRKNPHRKH
jgi:hypothetical protein